MATETKTNNINLRKLREALSIDPTDATRDTEAWAEYREALPFGSGLASESSLAESVQTLDRHQSDPDYPDSACTLHEFRADGLVWWGIETNGDPVIVTDWAEWYEGLELDSDFGDEADWARSYEACDAIQAYKADCDLDPALRFLGFSSGRVDNADLAEIRATTWGREWSDTLYVAARTPDGLRAYWDGEDALIFVYPQAEPSHLIAADAENYIIRSVKAGRLL